MEAFISLLSDGCFEPLFSSDDVLIDLFYWSELTAIAYLLPTIIVRAIRSDRMLGILLIMSSLLVIFILTIVLTVTQSFVFSSGLNRPFGQMLILVFFGFSFRFLIVHYAITFLKRYKNTFRHLFE
jgi:hypothetical protein